MKEKKFIQSLKLENVGPSSELSVSFGNRLNMFTGDNGLGKSFLLDLIWWVKTNTWAEQPAWPSKGPAIIWGDGFGSPFDPREQTWANFPEPDHRPQHLKQNYIILYARIDGSFLLWDSVRNKWNVGNNIAYPANFMSKLPTSFRFTENTLWDGLLEQGKPLCNGLIRDWVSWQNQPEADSPFGILKQVLKHLSPHMEEQIVPGVPTRVSLDDVRDIPTIELPYGNIPLIFASAGMKRIIGLAYLLVWAWYEHMKAVKLTDANPAKQMIFLFDEVEAHLHPQWQRSLLPALINVTGLLERSIQTQIIATTHSPLALASLEQYFDENQDKLFLFDTETKPEKTKREVSLREIPWVKQGDIVAWLTSDSFGLKKARSKESEQIIEFAEALMRGDLDNLPVHLNTKEQIHHKLQQTLPGHDPFWPRWIVSYDPSLKP